MGRKIGIFSALAFLVKVLGDLFKEIERLGGNEESFYVFKEKTNIEMIAEILVGRTISLASLIINLRLNWVSEAMIERNFLVLPEDKVKNKECKLFQFEKVISKKSAVIEMDSEGFRPATLRELLMWAEKSWNGKDEVIALGQTAYWGSGNPCLFVKRGCRSLGLDMMSEFCDKRTKYLAVRK